MHQNAYLGLIPVHFKISGEATEQKTFVQYLRVTLDTQLKWTDYTRPASSKTPGSLG